MGETYAYAVARIRALETSLLNNADIERLISFDDYKQCVQFLQEHGWGDGEVSDDAAKMLETEENKVWALIAELKIDDSNFAVLDIPRKFHNLKAAIKAAVNDPKDIELFYDTEPSGSKTVENIKNANFYLLPEGMQQVAKEAYEGLVHTGDGQLCDIIVDKACLEAMNCAGNAAKASVIREYAEAFVAMADIKIAVRSQNRGKSAAFMKRAMAPCRTLDIDRLIQAALAGEKEIAIYLATTPYRGVLEALQISPSKFENWCDNYIIDILKPQKYNAFTIGPIFAYVLARQNEIKSVKIILAGKQNWLLADEIRERVREMYV